MVELFKAAPARTGGGGQTAPKERVNEEAPPKYFPSSSLYNMSYEVLS